MNKEVKALFSLQDKVAAVIGGARHLGRDLAEALAEAGADVAITSRDASRAEETARSLSQATGRKILPLALDATDEAAVRFCFSKIGEHFGRLDILVNNAGGTVYRRRLSLC